MTQASRDDDTAHADSEPDPGQLALAIEAFIYGWPCAR
jgi:hypothetical protein